MERLDRVAGYRLYQSGPPRLLRMFSDPDPMSYRQKEPRH